ncbi:MAG: rRNA maturation RNase YbeY [Dehalococcoidia bacterium]
MGKERVEFLLKNYPCYAKMPERMDVLVMPDFELCVDIDEPFQGYLDERWLRRVVAETLAAEGANSPAELGLVVTGDERIRQLNKSYRGVDEATDVLSFALLEDSDASFVNPPDGVLHLGEVILSYPRAVVQAEEHHHPVEREVAFLVVHGVLHLLGHEHEQPHDEAKMRAEEERILGALAL